MAYTTIDDPEAYFQTVIWTGNGTDDRSITLPGDTDLQPDAVWVKCRSNASTEWTVYHKGLNGGTDPEDYYLALNDTDAETNDQYKWNDQAPTATHFSVGQALTVNETNYTYIAMLFASVDGISKVGSFTPDASGSFTVTTGFTPRFILMKPRNNSDNNWSSWWVYDSLRGLTSGQTNRLQMSSNAAQIAGSTNGTTATGINFTGWGDQSAYNWIYYAHA